MSLICYVSKRFREDKEILINQINDVVYDYAQQGYTLTLRQLYYQLVARGIIENSQRSYKNTGNLINDARLAGRIDWEAVEDRTRNLKRLSHWDSPDMIIKSAAQQYHRNWWQGQKYYLEIWVEKEALSEVVGKVADEWDVPYFCCRGYVSQSEMWNAANRLMAQISNEKYVKILHLGDHDPSGIDMTRDIEERLSMFGEHDCGYDFVDYFLNVPNGGIERIALNMEQIEEKNPPPNPAKLTDTRAQRYISQYGNESWELDALEPKYIHDLIEMKILEYVDYPKMSRVKDFENHERKVLLEVAEDWENLYNKYC